MTDHERVNPEGFYSRGVYSQVVVARGSTQYEFSGFCGVTPDFTVHEDFSGQAEQVVANLKHACAAVGLTLANVTRILIHTTDMARFRAEAGPIIYGAFGEAGAPPASTLVEVTALARPTFLLEVTMSAVSFD